MILFVLDRQRITCKGLQWAPKRRDRRRLVSRGSVAGGNEVSIGRPEMYGQVAAWIENRQLVGTKNVPYVERLYYE